MEKRPNTVNKPMKGKGKGVTSKNDFIYNTDVYDHVAGKSIITIFTSNHVGYLTLQQISEVIGS
eukprot:14315749-Ditylum_brightwellii.AAC.1